MNRLTIPEYAVALASVAALRSEDPFRKVGAVALDANNRVIGTAYNGLAPGYEAPEGFWDDRDARQKFMLHAEVNLCSLFVRGAAAIVATTTKPCTSCMQMLAAYGVLKVFYRDDYPKSEADVLAMHYGIELTQIDSPISLNAPLVVPSGIVPSDIQPPCKLFIDWWHALGHDCGMRLGHHAVLLGDFVNSQTQAAWVKFQANGNKPFLPSSTNITIDDANHLDALHIFGVILRDLAARAGGYPCAETLDPPPPVPIKMGRRVYQRAIVTPAVSPNAAGVLEIDLPFEVSPHDCPIVCDDTLGADTIEIRNHVPGYHELYTVTFS